MIWLLVMLGLVAVGYGVARLVRRLRKKKLEPNTILFNEHPNCRCEREHEQTQDRIYSFDNGWREVNAEDARRRYEALRMDRIYFDGCMTWSNSDSSVSSSLPHCFICNRLVDNKEAIADAELLEKYTGRDSGILCCNCFKVAKTIIDGREVKQNAEA